MTKDGPPGGGVLFLVLLLGSWTNSEEHQNQM